MWRKRQEGKVISGHRWGISGSEKENRKQGKRDKDREEASIFYQKVGKEPGKKKTKTGDTDNIEKQIRKATLQHRQGNLAFRMEHISRASIPQGPL